MPQKRSFEGTSAVKIVLVWSVVLSFEAENVSLLDKIRDVIGNRHG
jgi:hypothetical protein